MRFGLHGVVWATAAANLFALACIYRFNAWLGQRIDSGVWNVSGLFVYAKTASNADSAMPFDSSTFLRAA